MLETSTKWSMFLAFKEAGSTWYADTFLFHLLVIWNNGIWLLALMRSGILSLVGSRI